MDFDLKKMCRDCTTCMIGKRASGMSPRSDPASCCFQEEIAPVVLLTKRRRPPAVRRPNKIKKKIKQREDTTDGRIRLAAGGNQEAIMIDLGCALDFADLKQHVNLYRKPKSPYGNVNLHPELVPAPVYDKPLRQVQLMLYVTHLCTAPQPSRQIVVYVNFASQCAIMWIYKSQTHSDVHTISFEHIAKHVIHRATCGAYHGCAKRCHLDFEEDFELLQITIIKRLVLQALSSVRDVLGIVMDYLG